MFCNREKLRDEILKEISDLNLQSCFTVMTYQSLQERIRCKQQLPESDFFIADDGKAINCYSKSENSGEVTEKIYIRLHMILYTFT